MVGINSVAFLDGQGLEISFFEEHEQTERAGIMKGIVVSKVVIEEEYEELELLIQDIIDKGLLEIRNPAKKLNPRERIRRGLPPDESDDEDES